MFVYPTEYESDGQLARLVSSYSLLGIFLFQITMFGFFVAIFGNQLAWASLILITAEVTYYLFRKLINSCSEGINLQEKLNDEKINK